MNRLPGKLRAHFSNQARESAVICASPRCITRRGGARENLSRLCNGECIIEKGTDDEQQCPRCGFVPDDDDDEEVTRTIS
jgi:hypothetical protein